METPSPLPNFPNLLFPMPTQASKVQLTIAPLALLELTAHPAGTTQARQTLAVKSKSSHQLIANGTSVTTSRPSQMQGRARKVLISDVSHNSNTLRCLKIQQKHLCLLSKGYLTLFTVGKLTHWSFSCSVHQNSDKTPKNSRKQRSLWGEPNSTGFALN